MVRLGRPRARATLLGMLGAPLVCAILLMCGGATSSEREFARERQPWTQTHAVHHFSERGSCRLGSQACPNVRHLVTRLSDHLAQSWQANSDQGPLDIGITPGGIYAKPPKSKNRHKQVVARKSLMRGLRLPTMDLDERHQEQDVVQDPEEQKQWQGVKQEQDVVLDPEEQGKIQEMVQKTSRNFHSGQDGGILGRMDEAYTTDQITPDEVQAAMQQAGFTADTPEIAVAQLENLMESGKLAMIQSRLVAGTVTPAIARKELVDIGLLEPGTTMLELLGKLQSLVGNSSVKDAELVSELSKKTVLEGMKTNLNSTLADMTTRLKDLESKDTARVKEIEELREKYAKLKKKDGGAHTLLSIQAKAEQAKKEEKIRVMQEEVDSLKSLLNSNSTSSSVLDSMRKQMKDLQAVQQSGGNSTSSTEGDRVSPTSKPNPNPNSNPSSSPSQATGDLPQSSDSARLLKKFQNLFDQAHTGSSGAVADVIASAMKREGLDIDQQPLGNTDDELRPALKDVEFEHAVYGNDADGSMTFVCFVPT